MTILLIESSVSDRNQMESILKRGGYLNLAVAESVDEGLVMLGLGETTRTQSIFGVELVILGSGLPEDCADACRKIKESFHYQDVQIILTSAGSSADGTPLAVAYGALDYIRKPFSEYEFLARVRSALRLKHEVDRRKARERELIEATRQLSDLNGMLTRLALIDSLTGVANRRNFDRCLEKEWRRAFRNKLEISLIMTDIDFFKAYNDSYGHQGGDECLRNVARILKEALRRPGDVLCRYGGEEFVVILPDTPLAGAVVVAENLRQAVEKAALPHAHSKPAKHVTISLGVACMQPTDAGNPRLLIEAADACLYESKAQGRNRVTTRQVPPCAKAG